VKKIAVIPNATKDKDYLQTKKLVDFLFEKAEVVMPKNDEVSGIKAKYKGEDLFDGVDAVIILGGDGTMIRVAEPCSKNNIPVMGINLGKIGFMTEVEIADMETAVLRLLAENYKVEDRMMMEVRVIGEQQEKMYLALNDAVISKTDSAMVEMELYENGEKVSEYLADGLIVATPTGSTGYSLSAGGPVADPAMKLFIATPICEHRLASRPMLLSDQKEIEIKLADGGAEVALITLDGQDKCKINTCDIVRVTKSQYVLKIIKLGKQSFYYTMMAKL